MRSVGSSGVLSITFLAVTWPAALHGDASWTGQEGAVQRTLTVKPSAPR